MARKSRMVAVRYTGRAGRRVVDTYEWNAENGYTCRVKPEDVKRLIDNGDFVEAEAKSRGVGEPGGDGGDVVPSTDGLLVVDGEAE